MKITVLCVGKIKEKFYRDAILEYSKRLSRFTKYEIIEVADEKTKENASDKEISIVKDLEGEKILNKLNEDSYVITLEINGKTPDSVGLAEKIKEITLNGYSHIIIPTRCRYCVNIATDNIYITYTIIYGNYGKGRTAIIFIIEIQAT